MISCGENAFVTLLFSEETRNTIKFDLVSKKVVVCGGPFEGASEGILEVEVCDWLQRHHGIGLKPHDVGLRIARGLEPIGSTPLATISTAFSGTESTDCLDSLRTMPR